MEDVTDTANFLVDRQLLLESEEYSYAVQLITLCGTGSIAKIKETLHFQGVDLDADKLRKGKEILRSQGLLTSSLAIKNVVFDDEFSLVFSVSRLWE